MRLVEADVRREAVEVSPLYRALCGKRDVAVAMPEFLPPHGRLVFRCDQCGCEVVYRDTTDVLRPPPRCPEAPDPW